MTYKIEECIPRNNCFCIVHDGFRRKRLAYFMHDGNEGTFKLGPIIAEPESNGLLLRPMDFQCEEWEVLHENMLTLRD